jgi:hypothetical protein
MSANQMGILAKANEAFNNFHRELEQQIQYNIQLAIYS